MRLTEEEILRELQSNADSYAPLKLIRFDKGNSVTQNCGADALAEFSISDGPSFQALVEIRSVSNPKTIMNVCQSFSNCLQRADTKNLVPILIAPYIGKQQIDMLAKEGISWIDLSGNMVIQAGKEIYIERTGKPNKFPDTVPIKQIFQGTSSLAVRALLLKPEGFSSLYEIVDFISSRNGTITTSTVSKVLQSLENDLLIKKEKSGFYATEAERLLERLAEGYRNSVRRQDQKRYRYAVKNAPDVFTALSERQLDYGACGFYAAKLKGLAMTDEITVFIKSLEDATRAFELVSLDIKPDGEFGQLMLIETKDPCVWFNLQKQSFENVVDDLQLYLELLDSTPRGPAIAEHLKNRILKKGSNNG
jgi:hypothetical protein